MNKENDTIEVEVTAPKYFVTGDEKDLNIMIKQKQIITIPKQEHD